MIVNKTLIGRYVKEWTEENIDEEFKFREYQLEAIVDIIDNIIGTTTQPYTLKVYGKDGTMTGGETQTVNATNSSGSIYIGGMNNDAVKIGIVGVGNCISI